MKKSTFETKLANVNDARLGGYAGGPGGCPGEFATQLFKDEITGPWLLAYMLRRFGWPNSGSDPYKNLMSWVLTTPVQGLFLCVTPYLGHADEKFIYDPKEKFHSANLHFAWRLTKEIKRKLHADPGRDAFFKRQHEAISHWWKNTGIKLYAWGIGLKEGDPDELVHEYSDCEVKGKPMVAGLWRRTVTVKGRCDIPKQAHMVDWWLDELLKKHHPEVKLPKMRKRERLRRQNRFQIQARRAMVAAMKDLLRPTNVRDISFTPFGDINWSPKAVKHYTNQESAGYFPGAGMGPEYYYLHATKAEKAGKD